MAKVIFQSVRQMRYECVKWVSIVFMEFAFNGRQSSELIFSRENASK